jgi:hypothetical protein
MTNSSPFLMTTQSTVFYPSHKRITVNLPTQGESYIARVSRVGWTDFKFDKLAYFIDQRVNQIQLQISSQYFYRKDQYKLQDIVLTVEPVYLKVIPRSVVILIFYVIGIILISCLIYKKVKPIAER